MSITFKILRLCLLSILITTFIGLLFSPSVTESSVISDFNGDGYDDFVIGVPGETVGDIPDAGVVHIFYKTTGAKEFNEQMSVVSG